MDSSYDKALSNGSANSGASGASGASGLDGLSSDFGSFNSGGEGSIFSAEAEQSVAEQPVMASSQPVSSGTGDIILVKDKRSNSKKWWIILAVLAVVIGSVIIVVMLLSGRQSFTTNKNLKNVFNSYANYFISGEVNAGEVVINEENEVMYFDQVLGAEDNAEKAQYITNLKKYFEDFYKAYEDNLADSGDLKFINDYRTKLDLVMTYYNDGNLTRADVFDAYIEGGESKANELINKVSAAYSGLADVYGVNFGNLVADFGRQSLLLAQQYDGAGCFEGGEVNYLCTANNTNDEIDAALQVASDYYLDITSIVDDSDNVVHADIYTFMSEIYGEEELK